jgi:DNA replication and repair protein RecF
MPFKRARFSSFRNLEDAEIGTEAERIFLIGENGQGKTNFLEALYYLCYGSSFRGAVDAQIPATGAPGFGLTGVWSDSGAESVLDDEISVRVEGAAKDIRLNGKPLKDRKELVLHNPAVVFCHEDFTFAAGDPERRRFFFDQCAGMLSLSYIDSLRAYKRVLKQRNAALKESAYDLLDALDPLLASHGLDLMAARRRLHGRFQREFPSLYGVVSLLDAPVDLMYSPSWPEDASVDALLAALRDRRESEVFLGTTRSGPHRDRWDFSCAGERFTEKASTGQLRLVSLILRIIEARAYAESTATAGRAPRWPVLLLDDVLLELDVGRRRRFLELLPGPGEGAQAFFTFLPEEPWTEYEHGDTIVYEVSHGRFRREERL